MDWTLFFTELLKASAPIIAAALAALIGFLIKLVVEKIRSSSNTNLLMLAGVAVQYAETHFGPDTDTGKSKEALAIDFLLSRIKGLDRGVATQFVQAAYQAIFVGIAPLVPPQAPVATTVGSK